jgi:hypothetical protein
MSTTTLAVAVPEPLIAVPAKRGEAFDEWARALTQHRSSSPAGATIEVDLARLSATIDATNDPGLVWLIAVPDAPYHHGIGAIGWAKATAAGAVTADGLREGVAAAKAVNDTSAVMSDITHHVRGGREIAVAHLLQGILDSSEIGGDRLVERSSALMLDAAQDLLVRFELVAFDVRMFEDILATTLTVLESIVWSGDSR